LLLVVLDTNVIVSWLLVPYGPSAHIVGHLLAIGTYQGTRVVTPAALIELLEPVRWGEDGVSGGPALPVASSGVPD
jgi:hypothetical protein